MKRLLFAFALLFASVSAFADDRLRVTSLEKWLTYYLDPKPAEVAAALRQVPEQGLSEDDGAQAALSGFFAEILPTSGRDLPPRADIGFRVQSRELRAPSVRQEWVADSTSGFQVKSPPAFED